MSSFFDNYQCSFHPDEKYIEALLLYRLKINSNGVDSVPDFNSRSRLRHTSRPGHHAVKDTVGVAVRKSNGVAASESAESSLPKSSRCALYVAAGRLSATKSGGFSVDC